MPRFALLPGLLAASACATPAPQPPADAGSEGLTIVGPAEYCGSAARLSLEAGESITGLGATGLHGRIFTLTSATRSVVVTESDVGRPLAGTVVYRGNGSEVVRVRTRGGDFLYALQAPDGRHVRLECGYFSGTDADLPLVLRFGLRTYEQGETCNDPGRII